ncbi:MAG: PaaI family thioesterase [Pseudomonadota bacterium]
MTSAPANLADSMPFSAELGVHVTEATPERVTATLRVAAHHCTVGASVHGGAVMALADSVAAIGAFLALPTGASGTTTIESKTNFLGRAAEGAELTAVASPVSVGRRVSLWQSKITREDGKDVALVTQTQLVLSD